ncbi:predicted protein [Uncinocarpus reesii 1704]|uniref:Uncharacterized protein n=1 Tax=Uncinocarpus reesii (strain UAMH 1704) TaxID=336963 RepID=C4JZF0_UNCRE|nr:uncharacterized protein UREG_07551 [Uncinocarpus reesii 1704]EEP82686.1 predicted protein [Uncinocarpus reesii 1704]
MPTSSESSGVTGKLAGKSGHWGSRGDEILRALPRDTPWYYYSSISKMEKAVTNVERGKDRFNDQFVVFLEIPQHVVNQSASESGPFCKLRPDYLTKEKILILKMVSRPHEMICGEFLLVLFNSFGSLGHALRRELAIVGTAQVQGRDRAKSPDGSLIPLVLPPGRSDQWPAFVLEIGVSEGAAKPQRDAIWWLQESQGDVLLAVTIKLNRRKRSLTITKWEMVDKSTRRRNQRAEATQIITIVVPQDKENISIRNAPLVLPFRSIFARDPVGDEGDVIIDSAALEDFAKRVATQF